jgi:MFS family permease
MLWPVMHRSTADAPPPDSPGASRAAAVYRWYVLGMMFLVYAISIADRYVTSTVLEPIRRELKLSDSGIALLTGTAMAGFYVVLGFPFSWLIDRRNRRKIIAASLVAWSAMTLFTGLARTQLQFLLARIGVGVGEAGGTPGANSLLSDYFPAVRRPMALTIFSLGAPVGAFIAASVAGTIADRYGWRAVFVALGTAGIVAGVAIFLTVREPRRGQLDLTGDEPAPPLLATLRFLWQQRAAVHMMMAGGLTATWGWGLMFWTPALLQRRFGLTTGEVGDILGPIHLWGGGAATLLTGWWMARSSMADPRRIARLLGVCIGAASVISIALYWTDSLALTKALFWIFIPAINFYIGPCFGVINNLAQPRMRAVFCAAEIFVSNVGNLIVAPQLVGFFSDRFAPASGPTAQSLHLAVMCLVPFGFWAAAHYLWSIPHIVADQERATGLRVTVGAR